MEEGCSTCDVLLSYAAFSIGRSRFLMFLTHRVPLGSFLLGTCDTTVSLVIHGELHDDDDDVYSTPARD